MSLAAARRVQWSVLSLVNPCVKKVSENSSVSDCFLGILRVPARILRFSTRIDVKSSIARSRRLGGFLEILFSQAERHDPRHEGGGSGAGQRGHQEGCGSPAAPSCFRTRRGEGKHRSAADGTAAEISQARERSVLEAERLLALDRAHRTPDAVGAGAAGDRCRCRVTGVDRVGHERDAPVTE